MYKRALSQWDNGKILGQKVKILDLARHFATIFCFFWRKSTKKKKILTK